MDNNEDENFWNTFFDDSNFHSESLQKERNRLERVLSRNSPEREEQTFKCPKCDKSFSSKYSLSRHVKKGICEKEAPFICEHCGKVFRKPAFLKQHTDRGKCLRQHPRKTSTKSSTLICSMCNQTFAQVSNLKRHKDRKVCVNKTESKDEVFTCRHCGKIFRTAIHLRNHVDRAHSGKKTAPMPFDRSDGRRHTNGNRRIEPPSGSDSENDNNEEEFERGPLRQYRRTLFQERMTRYRLPAVEAERHDMLFFFANRRHQLKDNLVRERRRYMSVKWYMSVKVEMERIDATGEIADEAAPVFQSGSRILVNDEPIDDQINDAFLKMQRSFDTFKATGSGWRLKSVEHMEQSVIKFSPLGGSCFNYKIREGLSRKQCLLNITGPPELDGECFKYSILGALYTDESVVGDVPWSNFHPYKNSLTFDGIKGSGKHMPVTSIPCFERANNISINLYGYANHAFPIHISSYIDNGRKHIDLLLLEGREGDGMGGGFDTDEDEGSICQTIADNRRPHYCVIKDLGRLVASDGGNGKRRTFVCRRCLALRPDLESLRWHEKRCAEDEHHVSVTMPLETEKWLKFRNFQHRMSVSFVIVACFECYTTPLYDHDEPTEGYECRERQMDVCAYSYHRISVDNTYPKEPVYYRGSDPSDTMEHFLADMEKEENEIFQILSKIMPMVVCDEGLKNMEDSNDVCYICRDPFMPGEVKVTDHSHVSGKIRGRAHNRCNLQLKEQTFVPVVLQNLSRYEGRLILQAIAKHGAKKVKVIPQTIDTFVSVSVNKCRYLDFSRFLDVPLNDMVESMYTKSGFEPFDFVKQNFPADSLEKVIHKQYMCRDYLDSPIRLYETTLPDIGAFSDRISSKSLNEAEFQHLHDVWSYFGIQTLEQYLRHFVVVQVLLFADVLQNFRNTMMNDYLLDPLYYYSLPGYSYNCALFRTNVVLELIRDEEMYNTILSGIRGGITVVGSPRIARANLPNLPSFDAGKPVSEILFFDYNSLYPSCMIEFPLPTFGFRYLDQEEIQQFDISEYDTTSPKGYILVLDLEYPEELHDRDDMFPMCPENKTVTTAMLSDHTRNLAERCGITLKDERKLVQTLHSKSEYVVHYLTLKYYMEKGMVVTNVHKIIEFNQSPWLQEFIEYTCSRRRDAENEFVGMIHKSVACHVFGKCIENQKKRINVKLCTSYQQLLKLVRKPTFQAIRIFSENCAAIQFYNERVTLSRPVAVGFSILDLSKRKMYEFYHEFLLSEISSRGQLNILSCDTDSWLIHVAGCGDLGDIIWKKRDIFDLSSLPENSRFKDETNRRIPGKMKIQLGDSIITEAVVLSPKCYSVLTTKGNKTALKGMSCKLQHERYVDCLQHEESFTGSYRAVRHFGQELYHVSYRRRILSPIETKRYYLSANSSLSYGHYRLGELM